MKWVIFRGIGGEDDVIKVASYLKDKNVKYKTYQFEVDELIDYSSKNMSSSIEKICEILTDATHCILVNVQDIPVLPSYLYTLGMISHNSVSVFVSGARPELPASLLNGFFPACVDVEELLDRLDKYFPMFLEEEKKELARRKLFSMNIPLTPDSFSHYIVSDDEETCQIFIDAGLSPDVCDAAGTPMLCVAARFAKLLMLRWLIEKGANVNTVSKDRGYTPLMDAVWKNKYELVEYLIKAGADLNVISKDGQPLTVIAAGIGNEQICALLAENGADVNVKDNMGMSAKEYAVLFKNKKLIEAFNVEKK